MRQVARLLEAGVAAVIATARAIDDAMAREFAVAFYTELASAGYRSVRLTKRRGGVFWPPTTQFPRRTTAIVT